jgi:hypothetical protein
MKQQLPCAILPRCRAQDPDHLPRQPAARVGLPVCSAAGGWAETQWGRGSASERTSWRLALPRLCWAARTASACAANRRLQLSDLAARSDPAAQSRAHRRCSPRTARLCTARTSTATSRPSRRSGTQRTPPSAFWWLAGAGAGGGVCVRVCVCVCVCVWWGVVCVGGGCLRGGHAEEGEDRTHHRAGTALPTPRRSPR